MAAVVLASCGAPERRGVDNMTVQDLEVTRNLKVFFGHQSVGANVLEGVREIQKQHGAGPDIKDSLIGQNGDPDGKCEDFSRQLAALNPAPDVALMKFCYIDFDRNTDAAKLFARYSGTLDDLQTKYPATTFIPVTTPLTTTPAGWKKLIKSLLGRTDTASAVNAKRAEFNRLLEQRYVGRTVFDLARLESTNPDGSRNQFSWEGQTAYGLVDGYSSDGGHLNEAGRLQTAEGLIHTLAAAARARSARVSPPASGNASTSR